MAGLSCERLSRFLSTSHGGYTVWLGAGAAIASTKDAAHSWGQLVTTRATVERRKFRRAPADLRHHQPSSPTDMGSKGWRRILPCASHINLSPLGFPTSKLQHRYYFWQTPALQ